MEALFGEQQQLVNHFFNHLDHQEVQRVAELILTKNRSRKGIIYLTGMGKSGIVSHNISQMLVSIGIRAMFLSPVDALHGDVGVLTEDDVLILFSRSGQTSELINLLPAVRNKGSYMVAVVSNPDGVLAKQCNLVVNLPLQKELCPFDLAPTTSSIIQLIFGNTMVAYLMREVGLTKEEYAKNHPAGRIGKRLTVRIEDVMKKEDDLPICQTDDTLISQVEYMSAKMAGCLVVIDDDRRVLGIFTDGDLRRTIKQHGSEGLHKTMIEIMTPDPWTCQQEQMAFDAMQEMERYDPENGKKRIKEMPVVDSDGILVGLVVLHDLVNFGL